mmetsp:Transcript_47767/g.84096  ORF Transcript_47767/g.84096 Transcript_47767/m.84096 type:complete len:142 (-) Transcript_47767:151-576(-)
MRTDVFVLACLGCVVHARRLQTRERVEGDPLTPLATLLLTSTLPTAAFAPTSPGTPLHRRLPINKQKRLHQEVPRMNDAKNEDVQDFPPQFGFDLLDLLGLNSASDEKPQDLALILKSLRPPLLFVAGFLAQELVSGQQLF